MDPLMLMLLSAGLKAGQSAVTGAGQIDLLSAEEKNRKKELERRLALGELGLDEASKQQIMGQQMGPQQAAEREAFSRQAQQQQIADIGQGTAFRGQQALLEAGAIGRASATQRGQDVITERDVLAEAAQLREIDRLKAQRQQNFEGAGMIIGGVGDAALQASGGIMAKEYQDAVEASMLKAAETKAAGSVGNQTGASQPYLDWAKSQGAPPVVPPVVPPVAQPVPQEMQDAATQIAMQNAMQMMGVSPQAQQPTALQEGALINFGGEGSKSYGYKIEAIDPVTGLPSSVRWYKDGRLTDAVFEPGDPEYAEAMKMGGL